MNDLPPLDLPPLDLPPLDLPPLPNQDNAGLPDFPPVATVDLPRRRKAAIVVRFLLSEDVRLPLNLLPEPLQSALAHELAASPDIDKVTLNAVLAEFVAEADDLGLSFPANMSSALDILQGSISDGTLRRLRTTGGIEDTADPWERIVIVDDDKLLAPLGNESIEVAAVLLSKLGVTQAAGLLGRLPGERARRITYAISRTGVVSPDTVRTIGQALARELDVDTPTAFTEGPIDRIGAILNFAASATRDDVLEGLEQTDSVFAEQVRQAIFTFANIPTRINGRDIPKIMRDVEQNDLVCAIAASVGTDNETAATFILSNMSQRLAEALREESDALGKVKSTDADAAMNAIVAHIRELETRGEIFFLSGDDDEEA